MNYFIIKLRFTLFFVLVFLATRLQGQTMYTPYDNISAINKLDKPAYSENYPEWAKMLYQYPVNFHDICDKYDVYMQNPSERKNEIIRYFKNWKSAIELYVLDDGSIVVPDEMEQFLAKKEVLQNYRNVTKSISANNSSWTFLGPKDTYRRNTDINANAGQPAPWQANVYSFDVANSNHDILFCGTETGFLNKTTDKGMNWEICAPDYHFGGPISAVAINPSNPEIVYVSSSKQIHKTIDGGRTWHPKLVAGNIFLAVRLRIDKNNHNKIVAAASEGIFISSDGGETWAKAWSEQTWDIEIKPDDSQVIYGISSTQGQDFQLAISKDGGETFVVDQAFPKNIENFSGGLLAVTEADPNIVYASMLVQESDDKYADVYKGTYDAGSMSWVRTKRGEPRATAGLAGFSTGQGYFDFVLDVSPDDANTVFWGTCSLFKSSDGGYNFTKIGGYGGNFDIHPDIQDIKVMRDGKIWISTDGGMNYSTDYFTNTDNCSIRNKGLIGSHMWGFDMGWNEDIVVGGRYHNGNMVISDTYNDTTLFLGGAEAPTGWIVHGRNRQAVFSDINKGYTTSIPNTVGELVADRKFLFSMLPNMYLYGDRRGNLIHHPNYNSVLFLGEGKEFWKSSDMGETFDLLHSFEGDVMYLVNSYSNPDVIYADVNNYGLYRSEDGGKTWTRKPSLTNYYGNPSWNGYLHFVVSPYDENTIYACPQKASISWSAKVYKSVDGGDTWTDWSGSLSTDEFTKCLVIQPTESGEDLVYLFITAKNSIAGARGKVFFRKEGMTDWEDFGTDYPAAMTTIMALPFFRDSKIRVAGKGGIWESPMQESFEPIINPWVNKPVTDCETDTVYCDDHSMLDHEGVSWKWEITPEPEYISNPNIRNPKVVPGAVGSYDVKLEVTKNGKTYTSIMDDMFSVTQCASVDNCDNPGLLDKSEWKLINADSEEVDREATNIFDNDVSTIWHTEYKLTKPNHPHFVSIDLGAEYNIHEIKFTNASNGRIKEYRLYVGNNLYNWGTPDRWGMLSDVPNPDPISFTIPLVGRYLKIESLSEVNNQPYASMAEMDITGCYANATAVETRRVLEELKAHPVPTSGVVTLSLPGRSMLTYEIYSYSGQVLERGVIDTPAMEYNFDLSKYTSGLYLIKLKEKSGTQYRAKVIRE